MIEELARVISVNNGLAVVEVEKTSACGSCHAKGACGTSSFADFFNFKSPALTVRNSLNAKTGDSVLLALPEKTLLAGSFLLYIVPLISMMAMAGIASGYETGSEILQILSGLLGLIAGLLFSRALSFKLMKPGETARMIRVMPKQFHVSTEQLISR